MANKDRQKRSARKARAIERQKLEEERAASLAAPVATSQKAEAKKTSPRQDSAKKASKKKGRIRTWAAGVRSEMARVTWPSRKELKNYSVAVIGMLIVVGIAVWLIDTGVVTALLGYSGLRG